MRFVAGILVGMVLMVLWAVGDELADRRGFGD
jgi:hypothetical protein